MLCSLSQHKDEELRAVVARNTSLPKDVLDVLAEDCNPQVRLGVATNHATSPETLRKLSQEKHRDYKWFVLSNVGSNPNTPLDVLRELLKSTEGYSLLPAQSVASNYSSTPEMLDMLASHFDDNVRVLVVNNLVTSAETLSKLRNDKCNSVRFGVANHPNTTPDALVDLYWDCVGFVRRAASANPNMPKKVLQYTNYAGVGGEQFDFPLTTMQKLRESFNLSKP